MTILEAGNQNLRRCMHELEMEFQLLLGELMSMTFELVGRPFKF